MPHITRKMNILGLAVSLFAAACTTGNIEEPGRELRAIAFTPRAESRAAIDRVDDMSAFNVWGWHSDGTTTTNIFDATPVSRDAGWNYTDGVRYWQTGKTYDFYALHPSTFPDGMTAAVSADGTITVTGFDCSATGADAIDLMTASRTGIIYQAGETPQPVTLEFKHELTRLRFTVKSENSSLTVTSFSVYGVNYAGNFEKTTTNTHWTDLTLCTSADDTPYKTTGHLELNTTDGLERNIFGDVLLPPHETLDNARLRITYRFPGETTDRESVINLKIPGKTEAWTAGESYGYTLTIKGGSLSVTVKINPWDEKDTSVSWG